MDDGSKKSEKATTSLSIDRAAFLILRVKKAFKKKRQQRKDRQAAQQAAAALAANTSVGDRKGPPPLLRSRTLPSIIVPGIAILQNQIDASRLVPGDGFSGINFSARLSLQPRPSRSSIASDDNSFEYRRKSAGGSQLSSNNNNDPYIYACDDVERHADGTVVLRIPAPHVVAARAYRMSSSAGLLGVGCISSSSTSQQSNTTNISSSQEKTPLYRLAKLLNQNIKPSQCPILKDDTPRRLSWERRENAANNRLPRSASIDSMVEAVWSESPRPSLTVYPPEQAASTYSQNIQSVTINNESSSRRESLLSPSSGRRTKPHRGINSLFAAVENGHLDKARTILESTDVDVNSLNSDGLSPLDVAVLSNNRSLTKMLLQHGATEGTQFKNSDSLGNHLNSLLHDAENRIHELGSAADDASQPPFNTRSSFSSIIGNAYPCPSVTGCAGNEADKQIGIWERRVKGLRRMLLGWDQARPPDPPYCTTIDVTSINSVTIRIQESTEGAITTKFKIQWSTRCDFSNIVGDREVNEWNSFQGIMGSTCRISDLTQGRRYFFRACCGNVKGWGQYRPSIPLSVIPSSWRDIENKESRFTGRQRILDDLFTAVRLARPEDASEIQLDTPALQRRNPKKKTTIKQLFSAASKFQKNLKRGIYLACILYHEDKVLVTNEDFLPVVEIDENYPSCLHTDYNWLMKVACTWDDVKSLRNDMEKNPTSAVHFRTKLLSAVCQMQSALCIQDLGQLYHKPLRDSLGTVVLSCINNVKSSKSVSVLNSRWIPQNKIQKKLIAIHEDNNINEILLSSIQDQISYHQSSSIKLAKGLYIGYLKMQSSVDQIQIMVPTKTPNVLPHCKIRDNPHISAEEWDFLRTNRSKSSYEMAQNQPTDVQELFLEALIHAAHRIFKYMEISSEHALAHRLYNFEVMEFSPDIIRNGIDVTPKCFGRPQFDFDINETNLVDGGITLWELPGERSYKISSIQYDSHTSTSSLTKREAGMSMEEMCHQLGLGAVQDDGRVKADSEDDENKELEQPSFLKIILRETDDIVLYECTSGTVPKESGEAAAVLENNERYEYLTVGKGRHRPTLDAETQTAPVLMKVVSVNTDRLQTQTESTFVSNFEMYDTYTDLERVTESVDLDTENTLQMTTYSKDGVNVIDNILRKSKNFKFSSMVLQRLLASNIYREQQKRFRNMAMPDPLDLSVKYRYRLETLWIYKMTETIGKAVSCLSWCYANSDILAVGYGVYDFVPFVYRRSGYVAIWSIKNPINPERRYRFEHPVTALEFCKDTPQLLAVGFFNGTVKVLDISDCDTDSVVGKSQRNSAGFEPIWKMKWVNGEEELLTASEDGLVMKYKLVNGPYLFGQRQIKLEMVLGDVEGLTITNIHTTITVDRQPQALCIEVHPVHKDIFYVGTNEGCIHKCSILIPNQYSGILRVHKGCVSGIEFSPFSPKIYLTFGSDWYIRIWIEGVSQAIIELRQDFKPIRSARWCPNNSTIIASTTRFKIHIWDIKKSILRPASSVAFESPVTICRFSECGRSLIVGMLDGSVRVCALEDMPFAPHFQYNVLEEVINAAITTRPELQIQVKILGFLGYTKDTTKK